MQSSQRCNYSYVKLFKQLSGAHEIKQVWDNISSNFQCVIEKCALNFLCFLLGKYWKKNLQTFLGWVGENRKESGPQTSISLIIINQFHTHLCLISIGNLYYPIKSLRGDQVSHKNSTGNSWNKSVEVRHIHGDFKPI